MTDTQFSLSCPIPKSQYDHVVMAHGGGGSLMNNLIESVLRPVFTNPTLDQRHDSAVLNLGGVRIAFTTDSYVVHPLFFPGGDIGSMAVYGTVNDLAMSGARPVALSCGLILEEGLPLDTLRAVVASMQQAAHRCGVSIVTGDTKVVDKGKGDGVFINTSGVGIVEHGLTVAPSQVQPGDVILLNGDIGRHGIAIIAVRESLEFESAIESDSAPLSDLVLQMIAARIEVHCLRDLTRGGLASGLNEIAETAGVGMLLEESTIPVREDVRGACEILGFDPLYVANEGRMVAFIAAKDSDKALDIMRRHPQGEGSCLIGHVTQTGSTKVLMKSRLGAHRIIDRLSGEQLPRIC